MQEAREMIGLAMAVAGLALMLVSIWAITSFLLECRGRRKLHDAYLNERRERYRKYEAALRLKPPGPE